MQVNAQQLVPERWNRNYALYSTLRQAGQLDFLPQPDPMVLAANPEFNRATGAHTAKAKEIALVVLAVGGLYFFFMRKKRGK